MAIYYVGWDVGAWQCNDGDKPESHDAVAVFDEQFNFISCGRGNVRKYLKNKSSFAHFLSNFTVQEGMPIEFYDSDCFIIAIDAVL